MELTLIKSQETFFTNITFLNNTQFINIVKISNTQYILTAPKFTIINQNLPPSIKDQLHNQNFYYISHNHMVFGTFAKDFNELIELIPQNSPSKEKTNLSNLESKDIFKIIGDSLFKSSNSPPKKKSDPFDNENIPQILHLRKEIENIQKLLTDSALSKVDNISLEKELSYKKKQIYKLLEKP